MRRSNLVNTQELYKAYFKISKEIHNLLEKRYPEEMRHEIQEKISEVLKDIWKNLDVCIGQVHIWTYLGEDPIRGDRVIKPIPKYQCNGCKCSDKHDIQKSYQDYAGRIKTKEDSLSYYYLQEKNFDWVIIQYDGMKQFEIKCHKEERNSEEKKIIEIENSEVKKMRNNKEIELLTNLWCYFKGKKIKIFYFKISFFDPLRENRDKLTIADVILLWNTEFKRPPISDDEIKNLIPIHSLILSPYVIFDSRLRTRKDLSRLATVSIIIDSFAHNITAHALFSILQILRKRIEYYKQPQKDIDKINSGLLENLKKIIDEDLIKKAEKSKWSLLHLIKCGHDILKDFGHLLPPPLDEDFFKFLKYLSGKSALWSGVIRESVLGGEVYSWFEILKEFCDNPLFVGTIAATEKIYKVEFKVNEKEFLIIDVGKLFTEEPDRIDDFNFVRKGTGYNDLKESCLEKMEVFLPGGEVGKHALYTIFENILRNVKWTEKEVNGEKKIVFSIEINNDDKLYKVALYLDNLSECKKKINENEIDIDKYMMNELKKPIIDEYGKPKLGGLMQEKICASLLFTNSLDMVEDRELEYNGLKLYPWVHIEKEDIDNKCKVKTIFYLWKGEKLYEVL